MRRAARSLAVSGLVGLGACAGGAFDVRDFDGDVQPPQINTIEALTDRQEFLAALGGAPGDLPLACPDGRVLTKTTQVIAAPARILRVQTSDDDSGVQTIVVQVEGATILAGRSQSPGETTLASPGKNTATFRAATLGERRRTAFEVALGLPTGANTIVRVSVTVTDASGKETASGAYALGDRNTLCKPD